MATVAVIYALLWLLASWKLVKWKNWRDYYPTVLYASFGNMLYDFVFYNYPMWKMEPNGLPDSIIPSLLLSIIGMPFSTMVFLSNYPSKSMWRKIGYIVLFAGTFILLEYVAIRLGSITYHNGWNLGWSIFFVLVMFPILRLHHTKTLLGLVASGVVVIFLAGVFEITINKLR